MQVNLGRAITVTATERWLDEIRAGRAFSRGAFLGASVGNVSMVQLFNPVGSGVNVIVRLLIVSVDATGFAQVYQYNTPLTNDSGAGVNLLSGGAAGQAHVRNQVNAVSLGTLLHNIPILANTPIIPVADWFMELGPGEGVHVHTALQNVGTSGNFQWLEVP